MSGLTVFHGTIPFQGAYTLDNGSWSRFLSFHFRACIFPLSGPVTCDWVDKGEDYTLQGSIAGKNLEYYQTYGPKGLAMLFRSHLIEGRFAVLTWRGARNSVFELLSLKIRSLWCWVRWSRALKIVIARMLDTDVVKSLGDEIHHWTLLIAQIRSISLQHILMEY